MTISETIYACHNIIFAILVAPETVEYYTPNRQLKECEWVRARGTPSRWSAQCSNLFSFLIVKDYMLFCRLRLPQNSSKFYKTWKVPYEVILVRPLTIYVGEQVGSWDDEFLTMHCVSWILSTSYWFLIMTDWNLPLKVRSGLWNNQLGCNQKVLRLLEYHLMAVGTVPS